MKILTNSTTYAVIFYKTAKDQNSVDDANDGDIKTGEVRFRSLSTEDLKVYYPIKKRNL